MNKIVKIDEPVDHEETMAAALEVVSRKVVEDSLRTGVPLVLWRDGKVVHVPAEQYLAEVAAMSEQKKT